MKKITKVQSEKMQKKNIKNLSGFLGKREKSKQKTGRPNPKKRKMQLLNTQPVIIQDTG